MRLWLIVIGMGLITYSIRVVMFVLLDRITLTSGVRHGLRYVPTAVLSAIIFPELVRPEGGVDLSLGNARLLAGMVAAVVAWRTQNVLWTIAAGMGTLWLLQYMFAGIIVP